MYNQVFHLALFCLSALLIGSSPPAYSSYAGTFAALCGFSLFFRLLFDIQETKRRFWLSAAWFACVQLIQLAWLLSHPYVYIYILWLLLAFFMGLQFGIIGALANRQRLTSIRGALVLASLWTILEWSRLFVLSGFSWSPVGMALTSSVYALQFVSLGGIYLLSFWILLVNLIGLKAWIEKSLKTVSVWAALASFPFLLGTILYHHHANRLQQHEQKFNALLVQTNFPIEEAMPIWNTETMVHYVLEEWKQIFHLIAKHREQAIDLIALPEFVVPYGTYTTIFPKDQVHHLLTEAFGEAALLKLPPLQEPFIRAKMQPQGFVSYVNNAYILQSLANIFNSHVIAGLEDVEEVYVKQFEHYSAAQYVCPMCTQHIIPLGRYDKRVLVPMGEYIPFTFCKQLAAAYGIKGSFTPGMQAKVFEHPKGLLGISICYEETFGHLMRESRQLGANLMVNLTSDVWFPKVSEHHFDHARLRTVESGVPLVRACNTGVTCAVNSLGEIVQALDERLLPPDGEALFVQVPLYQYQTLYTAYGDHLVIATSAAFILLFLFKRRQL